jgi:hypothetical protein
MPLTARRQAEQARELAIAEARQAVLQLRQDRLDRAARNRAEEERAFRDWLDGFAVSRKGNLWRRWTVPGLGEFTLTVFFDRRRGGYRLCVAGTAGAAPYFSADDYEDETAALYALYAEVRDLQALALLDDLAAADG